MIVTKTQPFTADEIVKLKECFDVYIKTVIDLDNKICSAGMDRHFEGEQILIDQGSKQSNLWGGGIDLETMTIDFNSFINIKPLVDNSSNEIQSPEIRQRYEELTRFFFGEILK